MLDPNTVFLIDECLTLEIVPYAVENGFYMSAHATRRGLTSAPDSRIKDKCIENNWVAVTGNCDDFIKLYKKEPLHSGLICLYHENSDINGQCEFFQRALDEIRDRDLPDIVNKIVEVKFGSVEITDIF